MSDNDRGSALARIKTFLDERTGASAAAGAVFSREVPGGARWSHALGAALVWLFAVEFATGLALMTVYAPSVQTAWASVFYIQHHFGWGSLVRGVHYWAAQGMLVLAGLHLAQVLVAGAYRAPREFNWWLGLGLFGLVFAFAHTGSLLPWDQAAYWTTQVEANITGTMPVVGPQATRFMQGGSELGTLSLTRLYAAHVGLLPMLAVALILAHAALGRRHARLQGEPAVRGERYWPDQTFRNAIVAAVLVVAVFLLARRHGAPLEAPADPRSNYPARPEWYLQWLFKLRKYFEGPKEIIATAVLPGLATAFILAVPFIDRKGTRAGRAAALAGAGVLGLGVLGMTAVSIRGDARDQGFQRARVEVEQRAQRAMELASAGIPPEGPLVMVQNDPQVRPRELYEQHCAVCHAPAGTPLRDAHGARSRARAPTLDGFATREWARAVINHPAAPDLFGRTAIDDMPPQARRLGPEGVPAVAEYLYSLSVEPGDPPADAALAHRGDELFHNKCTVCHQGAGDLSETDAADRDAPDLTGWGSRAYLRSQIVHPEAPGNYGARNHMPGFADDLTPRELEWVIDYVRGPLRRRAAPVVQPPPPPPPDA